MIEVCHNLERYPQPKPFRNPGGDCFACAVTSAMPFLYPELAVPPDDWFDCVYPLFMNGRMHGSEEPCLDNSWRGMKLALDAVSRRYGRLEVHYEMPEPHFHRATWRDEGHQGWAFQIAGSYVRVLEGMLRGGWVAFTTVSALGGGPTVTKKDGSVWFNSIDHFIVLDGVRSVYEEELNEAASSRAGWNDYLHVVDSSTRKLSGWHRDLPFLLRYGACAWWLARRDTR